MFVSQSRKPRAVARTDEEVPVSELFEVPPTDSIEVMEWRFVTRTDTDAKLCSCINPCATLDVYIHHMGYMGRYNVSYSQNMPMLVRIDNVALGDVWSRLAQTERSDGPNTACNISLDLKLKHLSDDVIRLLKVTKAFSTTAEKGDQPELLHTVNLAVTLHSGTAAPLDIIYICVVRPMMP